MTKSPDLYGSTLECDCGKTHRIIPREVIYHQQAVKELPGVLARSTQGRRLAILMDQRTRKAAGEDILKELEHSEWKVFDLVVPDSGPGLSPVCDDITQKKLFREIPEVDFFLPVGSGVINDLGKWLAVERNTGFVCFATAASMNGYTSANVAPTIDGVKSILRGNPPLAVLSSPEVIANAPYEMTAAGLGDILAKSVSSLDWYLNHFLFGDYYCEASINLIVDIEPLYFNYPKDIYERKPKAIEALFQGLLLTGVAMTMAESSAPASGGEHLISHTLDMMSHLDNSPHDLHGRQVGIGTILSAELYRRVMDLESPEFRVPDLTVDTRFWKKLGKNVEEQYKAKSERLKTAKTVLQNANAWDTLRTELKPRLRSPHQIQSCLEQAGAAWRAEHIRCDRSRLLAAFQHAHEIRPRFTILDLAQITGILPGAIEDIIQEWA